MIPMQVGDKYSDDLPKIEALEAELPLRSFATVY